MPLEYAEEQLETRGLQTWSLEIPVETFGTEEARKQNFERLLQEIAEEKRKQDIPEEEFRGRLKQAREFVETLPLFHTTSLKSAVEAFHSGKILSLSELEKTKRVNEELMENHTYQNDRNAGLDRLVFLTTQFTSFPLLDAVLRVPGNILERPDVVVTAEDIGEIPSRLAHGTGLTFKIWTEEPLPPDLYSDVLEEYRNQSISGKDFREFLTHLIATYHQDSTEYIKYLRRSLKEETFWFVITNHCDNYRIKGKTPPLHLKRWYGAEIKVPKMVTLKEKPLVLVGSEVKANLLTKEGVPSDLIRVGDIWFPEELYRLSSDH